MSLPAFQYPKYQSNPFSCADAPLREPKVQVIATAKLPSRFGNFTVVAFANDRDGKEHAAFIKGEVTDLHNIPVRVHSECLTGDVMGSLRCDCRDQLEAGLKYIGAQEQGVLLYLRQEGRGIGLINKIRAYALQDKGMDTVEANHALGFEDDLRDYAVAAGMLKALKVRSIKLLSNNPKKVEGLQKNGVIISERIPHLLPTNPHNRQYLETKAKKSGHIIELDSLR